MNILPKLLNVQRPHRRQMLWAGALGSVGLSLPQLFAAETNARPAREKSVIVILPWGGPCQLDTFDLKPDAPADIRGEFKPIQSTVPGLHICEHLPRLAMLARDYAIVRSMSHRISTHNPATHYALTGHKPAIADRELVPASRMDFPSLGSVLAKLKPASDALPSYVVEPCSLVDNGSFSGGQTAGFLGSAFDPFVISADPSKADFTLEGLALTKEMSTERLAERRALLAHLSGNDLPPHHARAYDLLSSTFTREAFNLRAEPIKLRERYGMTRYGQSVLVARRLVEAGVRLVLVSDTKVGINERWDTHSGNVYSDVRKQLDETDAALFALFDDLRDRGLLETTIVLWMAEFGRTPKMQKDGGRDHWPQVYSLLMAGGGIRGGQVYGASDKIASVPRDLPVAPEDIHATMYKLLGIPLDTIITDPTGRPTVLCNGRPIDALMS